MDEQSVERPYRTKIGHAHLKVRDLERAVQFYARVLGFNVTERLGTQYAFLSGGEAHHELALRSMGPSAPDPDPAGVGLYHVAFEVPDRRSFALAYRTLVESSVPLRTVDHRISWAMYFDDPDGNTIEVYWDARRATDGAPRWEGQSRPLPEATILAALRLHDPER